MYDSYLPLKTCTNYKELLFLLLPGTFLIPPVIAAMLFMSI